MPANGDALEKGTDKEVKHRKNALIACAPFDSKGLGCQTYVIQFLAALLLLKVLPKSKSSPPPCLLKQNSGPTNMFLFTQFSDAFLRMFTEAFSTYSISRDKQSSTIMSGVTCNV